MRGVGVHPEDRGRGGSVRGTTGCGGAVNGSRGDPKKDEEAEEKDRPN